MAYQVKYMSKEAEAVRPMPFTGGMTRDEIRLVSCPQCGAVCAAWCYWPNTSDPSVFRRKSRIHKRRIEKATEYRAEHRI